MRRHGIRVPLEFNTVPTLHALARLIQEAGEGLMITSPDGSSFTTFDPADIKAILESSEML